MKNSVERQKFRKEPNTNLGNKNLNKLIKNNRLKKKTSVETFIVRLDQVKQRLSIPEDKSDEISHSDNKKRKN